MKSGAPNIAQSKPSPKSFRNFLFSGPCQTQYVAKSKQYLSKLLATSSGTIYISSSLSWLKITSLNGSHTFVKLEFDLLGYLLLRYFTQARIIRIIATNSATVLTTPKIAAKPMPMPAIIYIPSFVKLEFIFENSLQYQHRWLPNDWLFSFHTVSHRQTLDCQNLWLPQSFPQPLLELLLDRHRH